MKVYKAERKTIVLNPLYSEILHLSCSITRSHLSPSCPLNCLYKHIRVVTKSNSRGCWVQNNGERTLDAEKTHINNSLKLWRFFLFLSSLICCWLMNDSLDTIYVLHHSIFVCLPTFRYGIHSVSSLIHIVDGKCVPSAPFQPFSVPHLQNQLVLE